MSKEKLELSSVNVKFFASIREIVGKGELTLRLETNATVSDLRRMLLDLYPALTSIRIPIMIAVNRRIADENTVLSNKDEVALLPPVSGG